MYRLVMYTDMLHMLTNINSFCQEVKGRIEGQEDTPETSQDRVGWLDSICLVLATLLEDSFYLPPEVGGKDEA